jgi:hypothetical protein
MLCLILTLISGSALLPTRFELVLLDSKSNVLTTTLWKRKNIVSKTLTHHFTWECLYIEIKI